MSRSLHTIEFRELALIKVRGRGTRRVQDVANDLHMAVGTLRKWLSKSNQAKGEVSESAVQPPDDLPAQSWGLAQRLQALLELIGQACTGGARLKRACAQIGPSARTVQRWQHPDGQDGDHRVRGLHERAEPINKLSAFEHKAAMALLNGEESKICRPVRSCRAWPAKGATSPANRRCIGYCTRPAR